MFVKNISSKLLDIGGRFLAPGDAEFVLQPDDPGIRDAVEQGDLIEVAQSSHPKEEKPQAKTARSRAKSTPKEDTK